MIMTKKFEILGKYIKDLSSETPDIETYLFVKERISKSVLLNIFNGMNFRSSHGQHKHRLFFLPMGVLQHL